MSRHQTHSEDCIALLGEQAATRSIDRRRLMQLATLLGATTAMGGRAAYAQAKEIVLANAGGDAVTGAATVILAMGAGKAAARDIDRVLTAGG